MTSGNDLLKKAEKELKKMVKLFGNKYSTALNLFQQASEMFRQETELYMVGHCLVKCADICDKVKGKSSKDRSQFLKDAALSFQLHFESELQRLLSLIANTEADIILHEEKEGMAKDEEEGENKDAEGEEPGHDNEQDSNELLSEVTAKLDRTIANVPTHGAVNDNANDERRSELEDKIRSLREQIPQIKGFSEMRESLECAAEALLEIGESNQAARTQRDLGLYIVANAKYRPEADATTYFKEAAENYEAAQNFQMANRALTEQYSALCDYKEFDKAAYVLEYDLLGADWNRDKSASGSKDLLQFDINKLIFHLMLIKIAEVNQKNFEIEDIEGLQNELNSLCNMYGRNFGKTMEFKVLQAALSALEAKNILLFVRAIKNLNLVKPLDEWHTRIMLTIRRQFEEIVTNEDHT